MRLKRVIKELFGSPVSRVFKNKMLITGVLFSIWVLFFDSSSIVELSKVVINISKQESQKMYYKESIKLIDEKLNELSSNRDSLEKFAREQYYFKEDDEDIFIIEKKK